MCSIQHFSQTFDLEFMDKKYHKYHYFCDTVSTQREVKELTPADMETKKGHIHHYFSWKIAEAQSYITATFIILLPLQLQTAQAIQRSITFSPIATTVALPNVLPSLSILADC